MSTQLGNMSLEPTIDKKISEENNACQNFKIHLWNQRENLHDMLLSPEDNILKIMFNQFIKYNKFYN